MAVIIETSRLILREWQDKDSELYYQINNDPKVIEFLRGALSKDEVREFIACQNKALVKNGFCFYAAQHKETEDFMGFIGFSIPNFDSHFTPAVEIGWRLGSKWWGSGYATEGAKACIEYGFKDLGFDEIVSFTAVQNIRSIKVMERIGMQRDLMGDFNHPNLDADHRLLKHLLYRI